jgi:uncharacterized membrane protein YgaE (UPF0421/DUF939 family)
MDTLVHADIFFFVSTVALIVIGIGVAIALFYLIRILKDISHVSGKVKEESDAIITDVRTLRGHIKTEGFKMKYLSGFMKSVFKRRSSKKSKSE